MQRQQQRGVASFAWVFQVGLWLRSSVWSVIVFRHFNLITAFKLSLCAHQRNNKLDQNRTELKRTEQNIIFKFVMINLLIVCSSFENRHQSDCVFPSGSPFVGSSMKRLLLPNQRKAIRHKNHHHCFDFFYMRAKGISSLPLMMDEGKKFFAYNGMPGSII